MTDQDFAAYPDDMDIDVLGDDAMDPHVGFRRRGADGPTDVTFSVCLDQPAKHGEVVYLTGSPKELSPPGTPGVAMHQCPTGNGKLWTCTVVLDLKGVGGGGGGNSTVGPGMMLGALGLGFGSGAAAEKPLFNCSYLLGSEVSGSAKFLKEEKTHDEFGSVKHYYYHKANFYSKEKEEKDTETFPLFVHDLILLLQSGSVDSKDFLNRFSQLAQAPFAKKRSLLDKALEELIEHWGKEMEPPSFLVLAVAATLGHFRRQQSSSLSGLGAWSDVDISHIGLGSDLGAGGGKEKEKEKDAPPSLSVCRWLVQHCPSRQQLEDEEAKARQDRAQALAAQGGDAAPKERGRGGMDHSNHQWQRLSQLGVLHAADTLYSGEKSFEWIKLLTFLPEHQLPNPVSLSQITEDPAKLEKSFLETMSKVLYTIGEKRIQIASMHWGDTEAEMKEKSRREAELTGLVELYIGGLCRFCPSVDCIQKLFERVAQDLPDYSQTVGNFILSRFRSLCFGSRDKDDLKAMLKKFPCFLIDEVAVCLLTNSHHPSDAFKAEEIIQFVKIVTETRDGVRPAGHQLQQAVKRWLNRNFGRSSDRQDRRTEEMARMHGVAAGGREYLQMKEEVREQIRTAIRGWHMVLSQGCFKQEEECLRLIVFDLTQASFFKDNDHFMVLDAMLELEDEIIRTRSVKHLEDELQRVMVRLTRDVTDNPEPTAYEDENEKLLELLFRKPTEKRFYILEALISMRQAGGTIDAILRNERIWFSLLQPTWLKNPALSQYEPLRNTQSQGIDILTRTAKELEKKDICLSELHVIIRYEAVYRRLVGSQTSINQAALEQIAESKRLITKFDNEHTYLKTYVKLFCTAGNIQADDLQVMLNNISSTYQFMKLKDAEKKFNNLAMDRMEWLYNLRSSDVFLNIWKEKCGVNAWRMDQEQMRKQNQMSQDDVAKTYKLARDTWEDLAKTIETGTAIYDNIRWCVEMEWVKVQSELLLLEKTAPARAEWSKRAMDMTKAMRMAAKLRDWAPSMLHLKEVLKALFTDGTKDECAELLRNVVKTHENLFKMKLAEMENLVKPYKATIETLTDLMQDYTIKLADPSKDAVLLHVLEHNDLDAFNALMKLVSPNTDDAVVLGALASLKHTRTFLSDTLYTKPPYATLGEFLKQLSTLEVDEQVVSSLDSIQLNFTQLLSLLTTQSRTPGVQACYDLVSLTAAGEFTVICSSNPENQITCKIKESGTETSLGQKQKLTYDFLEDLRRTLLMQNFEDIPASEDLKDLPDKMDQFITKFTLMEACGRCSRDLLNLGHFSFEEGKQVRVVKPGEDAKALKAFSDSLEAKLADWTSAVEKARFKHYYINYFTLRELCYLVKFIPKVSGSEDASWKAVWPLLCAVAPNAESKQIRDSISTHKGLKACEEGDEVSRLMALGAVLSDCFSGFFSIKPPNKRALGGVKQSKQLLQGDLLMQAMKTSEKGEPIFVCCAEEPSKVTELILSIYTRRERVPEAEELLLCSGNTTMEQIELLLWRFFSARKHDREDRLYCLGNIHLLPYVVQCGTVENLRKLEELFGGYGEASALVFVSGLQNQMLTNALNQHNIAVSVMPQDNLRDAVQKVGQLYHGQESKPKRGIEAVAAKMNGVGKTHYILRQMHEEQQKHRDQPIRHHIEIRETTDVEGLVQALLNDPTDPQIPTAVHIDLAHILPTYVDTLLFEILIVGMLRDPANCRVYHRRSIDFFFVEIPNTPEESTAKQLSFCLLLPRTYLTMSRDAIETELPDFEVVEVSHSGNDQPSYPKKVVFKTNNYLHLCGKTLEAMKKEQFNPKSKDFKVTWRAATEANLEKEETYDRLHEVCCSDTSPPSFLVFTNFVKFMGEMISLAETWNMMNLQLLQNFDPGLKNFKHCFFRLLIETSRDFALRQVPKDMPRVDASPLALQQSQRLLRQLSSAGQSSEARGLGRTISAQGSQVNIKRTVSRTVSQNATTHAEVETGGVGRVDITTYAKRFDQMPAWESMVHPIASFKKNDMGGVLGCSIMSLSPTFLGTFIDRNLQNSLNLNDLKLEKDWSNVTYQEAVQLVYYVEGGDLLKKVKDLNQIGNPTDYVVTVDNLIKLLSIQQRLRYDLPVILMGETGCGKTALVKFLGKTLQFKLCTLDIHGGITDADIISFMEESIDHARESSHRGVLIFFDEINASNCMALFKSIIVDRVYGNKVVPHNVRIISCCNPYRFRLNLEDENMGLVFQHHQGDAGASGITDPMKKLVYRVHPLPESLVDVVNDFGALSEKSEELYIQAIMEKDIPAADEDRKEYDVFMHCFKDLLCASQCFVREVNNGERSVVSMRDIARSACVFKWFLKYYATVVGDAPPVEEDGTMKISLTANMRPHLRSAVILTLGYCYHARLNRNHRWGYRKKICDTWKQMKSGDGPGVSWLNLDGEDSFNKQIIDTQYAFVKDMNMDEGVSLNEALRENLFMLLVSIMNQIPILLIGKPGCSKSLAMEILQNNLNGANSAVESYRTMPNVDVFPYQCSPLSTPDAILKAFQHARKSNLAGSKTIVTVLLDEVGLAEQSPHLPLKVLHKELEDLQGIACVGISNWALDAAKMSRCVTLYRPPPTVDDLIVTAEGMVASEALRGYLKSLSEAFWEVYKGQPRSEFWGMREFYSTVRVINAELKVRLKDGQGASLEPQVLMKTVQRNFGGCSAADLEACLEEFFFRTGLDQELAQQYATTELIEQNLEELDARHLMLLTKNNAALRLLFESKILDHGKAEVMFGGTFPGDLSDVSVAMSLQKIKAYMQKPIALVMVHCDSLYESLYDLFNQHYMNFAGRRYVRIAHGSKSNLREVHKQFRVIVLTEISDAYFRLAPPLLNRFEKQIFLRKELMKTDDEVMLKKIQHFWQAMQEAIGSQEKEVSVEEPEEEMKAAVSGAICRPIAGYHPELLSSLAFTVRRGKKMTTATAEDQLAEARRKLTAVFTPESICIVAAKYSQEQRETRFGLDLVKEYFENQRHSDLPSFAESLIESKDAWLDDHGAQIVAMTYSPIRGKCGGDLKQYSSVPPAEASLHDLSTSHDLDKLVEDFYSAAVSTCKPKDNRFLIIHADPMAANLRMIELCRFRCEKTRQAKLANASSETGGVFVILVVHLQRASDRAFSFDFDSQWDFFFLDSVEPSADVGNMPLLGSLLNTSLIEVVKKLEFDKLLKQSFRSALSRLMYPHVRKAGNLSSQINQLLAYLDDKDFIEATKEFMLNVLATTPSPKKRDGGMVGHDPHWFAEMATAAHELALAGTFRAALTGKVVVLVTSLLTTLLAHLDRNGGLALLADPKKRDLWLTLARASLQSPLSVRLHAEAREAITESATAQHEVGTDAQTAARPFTSKFPSSWFVCRNITLFRQNTEYHSEGDQLKSLRASFDISNLKERRFDPSLSEIPRVTYLDGGEVREEVRAENEETSQELLYAYLSDFTAMHLDFTERLDRSIQQSIVEKTLIRKKRMLTGTRDARLENLLEIHQMFWNQEKFIAWTVNLLNEVPDAVETAKQLIETSKQETLELDVLLLVHKTLTEELKEPPPKATSEPDRYYREWSLRKRVVAGLTKDFLATQPKGGELLAKLTSDAEPRVETLALLISHVASPLDMQLSIVREFAKNLPKDKIRKAQTLTAILRLGDKLINKDELQAISTFAESWMLDVCLRDETTTLDLDNDCLSLFCSLSAGLPLKMQSSSPAGLEPHDFSAWKDFGEVCIATCSNGAAEIPRSSCLNLALLRKLLAGSDESPAKKAAQNNIKQLLQEVGKYQTHNDTTFATKYAVLSEEWARIEFAQRTKPEEWPDMKLEEVFSPPPSEGPAKMLEDIGKIRWMLSEYAAATCKEDLATRPEDYDRYLKIQNKVDGLLQTNDDALNWICRSMRLYFLKCLERKKGVSFVRNLLAVQPLCDAPWVQKWRQSHDIDFEKFIGAALVPKWTPFCIPDVTQDYADAKSAVLELMMSTQITKLDKFGIEAKKQKPERQKQLVAALLMALCQEPGLLAALEDGAEPGWRPILNNWLETTENLPVTDQERMLLRVFAGNHRVLAGLTCAGQLKPFTVSEIEGVTTRPDMDGLLRWRLLAHLAAVLIAAPKTSVLASLRALMLQPNEFIKGEPAFLPGMDEDIRNRVLKALLERGENIWKMKSHWYKCTYCGYNFFIGECGRPMEETKCPECSKPIGGKDHNKTGFTTEDDESDRSPVGYMLPPADKDEKHVSFREIPASSARAIRLLLHGAMFCGIAAHIPATASSASPGSLALPRVYANLVNTDSQCTMMQSDEPQYIGQHFLNDVAQMVEMMSSNVEDLVASFHALLAKMSDPKSAIDNPKNASNEPDWTKLNLEMRRSWEETTETKYLTVMIKDYVAQLSGLFVKWGGAAEEGKFVSELKEIADVRDYPSDKRRSEMPQVWAFRTQVTLSALHSNMAVQRDASSRLPVLSSVLQQQYYPILGALRCLVGIFEWHQLVMNHFSGRISRNYASNTTVQEIFEGLSPSDKIKWKNAFREFETAWRISWQYIERHECLEIPEALRNIMVDETSALVFCIPDSENEGICPLALTQWLVARHNELVQIVSGVTRQPARKVSSRLLGIHDVISYDGDALTRFLKDRCVTYGDGGKLLFDLSQLEQRLRREMSRPEISIELRAFQWLGEHFTQAFELKSVMNQKPLSSEVADRIKGEISNPTLANACLQQVSMSVAFILKTGGGLGEKNSSDMLLSDYISTVLCDENNLPSNTARCEVALKHIDAFATLLKQIINSDPMDYVDSRYKEQIPDEMARIIDACKSTLPPTLVDNLADFAGDHLGKDGGIGPDTALMETLSVAWNDLFQSPPDELADIKVKLPKDLKVKHWVALYRMLKKKDDQTQK